MPRRYYTIDLGESVQVHVYFETMNGLVVAYVVKLIVWIDGNHYEVLRFDNVHGCPHKDVLNTKGSVDRKIWFELLDNPQGLDMAIKYLKDNYELYIERFKKWLKN